MNSGSPPMIPLPVTGGGTGVSVGVAVDVGGGVGTGVEVGEALVQATEANATTPMITASPLLLNTGRMFTEFTSRIFACHRNPHGKANLPDRGSRSAFRSKLTIAGVSLADGVSAG